MGEYVPANMICQKMLEAKMFQTLNFDFHDYSMLPLLTDFMNILNTHKNHNNFPRICLMHATDSNYIQDGSCAHTVTGRSPCPDRQAGLAWEFPSIRPEEHPIWRHINTYHFYLTYGDFKDNNF